MQEELNPKKKKKKKLNLKTQKSLTFNAQNRLINKSEAQGFYVAFEK
jgi:hypothetical protein